MHKKFRNRERESVKKYVRNWDTKGRPFVRSFYVKKYVFTINSMCLKKIKLSVS